MALRIGPFAFFLRVIDDTEYATLLARVLDTILGGVQIIRRGGGEIRGVDDPGDYFETYLPYFRDHMMVCQEVHNSMLDVRPAGKLFGVHKGLLSVVKAYSFAVADHEALSSSVSISR